MKISPIQRTQVMIELLAADKLEEYREALALVRNHTGEFDLTSRPGFTRSDLRLPVGPNQLLRELRNHLNAICLSKEHSLDEDFFCRTLLDRLPPMPTEFESEEEQPEVPSCDLMNRPLEEEKFFRSSRYASASKGFDAALLIRIGSHPLGHGHVVGKVGGIKKDLSEVESVREVHSSDRGIRVLSEWTVELVEDDAQPPAWKLVLIIRPSADDKRGAACRIQQAIEKIEGVESVQYLKAWDDGLDCEHLWAESGREFLRLFPKGYYSGVRPSVDGRGY